jgi:Skp family chaperone for outer membrane proteins
MRKCTFFLIGLGFVFSICGAASSAEDAVEVRAPEPLKIGVINITKVFDEYQKKLDGRVELEKKRSEMQATLEKKEKEMRKLEQASDVLEGEEKLKKRAEFEEKKKDYRAYLKVNQPELQKKQCELWITVYNEIIDQIKRSAEDDGYDIILNMKDGPVSGERLEDIQLRVDIKKVLFHSSKVDLTDEIISVLNEKYKRVKESKEKR